MPEKEVFEVEKGKYLVWYDWSLYVVTKTPIGYHVKYLGDGNHMYLLAKVLGKGGESSETR